MSLSLGQSQSYINNIENKKALPSMQMFLYICEFLDVEPKDFFEENVISPCTLNEAVVTFKSLSPKQLGLLIALAQEFSIFQVKKSTKRLTNYTECGIIKI